MSQCHRPSLAHGPAQPMGQPSRLPVRHSTARPLPHLRSSRRPALLAGSGCPEPGPSRRSALLLPPRPPPCAGAARGRSRRGPPPHGAAPSAAPARRRARPRSPQLRPLARPLSWTTPQPSQRAHNRLRLRHHTSQLWGRLRLHSKTLHQPEAKPLSRALIPLQQRAAPASAPSLQPLPPLPLPLAALAIRKTVLQA